MTTGGRAPSNPACAIRTPNCVLLTAPSVSERRAM